MSDKYSRRKAAYNAKRDAFVKEIDDEIHYRLYTNGVYARIHQAGDQARVILAVGFTASRMRIHDILPKEDIEYGEQRLSELLRHAWDDQAPDPEALYIASALSKNHELAMELITRFAGDETTFEIANAMFNEQQAQSKRISLPQWQALVSKLADDPRGQALEEERYTSTPRGR